MQKTLNQINIGLIFIRNLFRLIPDGILFGVQDIQIINIYYFCQPCPVGEKRFNIGEMAEWSNAAVSKTVVRLPANRGFESPSLRKVFINPDLSGFFILPKRR